MLERGSAIRGCIGNEGSGGSEGTEIDMDIGT